MAVKRQSRVVFSVFAIVVVFSLFLQGWSVVDNDWPSAGRDPGRSGHASSERTLYPPLKERVLVRIPRGGIQGLAVVGDRIFISAGGANNTVYAVNARTGEIHWSFVLEKGTGSMLVTPAYADNTVYFGGQNDDKLYAVDASTGRLKWALTGMVNMYGMQPVVVGDTLYTSSAVAYYAINARTGEIIWRFSPSWSPDLFAVWNNRVFLRNGPSLHALKADDGAEVWRADVGQATGWAGVLVSDGKVFTHTQNRVLAYEASAGRLIWESRLDVSEISRLTHGALAEANGIVYTAVWNNGRGIGGLVALDASNGRIVWSFETKGEGTFTPVVANGVVYFVGWRDTTLYALEARTGQQLWSYQIGSGASSLAVAHGVLYVPSGNVLLAFSREETTTTTTTTPTTTAPATETRTQTTPTTIQTTIPQTTETRTQTTTPKGTTPATEPRTTTTTRAETTTPTATWTLPEVQPTTNGWGLIAVIAAALATVMVVLLVVVRRR